MLLDGRRSGVPGSPVAFETKLGWVIAGSTSAPTLEGTVPTFHSTLLTGDDLLRKFWELEENPSENPVLSPEEKTVVRHFETRHYRSESGRYIVPLPKKPDVGPLGESRSQAVRRFTQFERSLHSKGIFPKFKAVIDEYFDMNLFLTRTLRNHRTKCFIFRYMLSPRSLVPQRRYVQCSMPL